MTFNPLKLSDLTTKYIPWSRNLNQNAQFHLSIFEERNLKENEDVTFLQFVQQWLVIEE